MRHRLFFPVLMALAGVAVLLSLGLWQMQRLQWKEAILATITQRMTASPVSLPAAPDAQADIYQAVQVTGALTGQEILVLTAYDGGPGYRVISVLDTGARRIMVDLGFIGTEAAAQPRQANAVTVQGNLHWPDEVDGWTPAPDGQVWFARDVGAMAAALDTDPVLVIAAAVSGADLGVTLLPIDTAAVPNNHLGYAITWFAMALVWAVMSGFFIFRISRTARED